MYYEIYGEGAPLLLLHGGFGLTGMFSEVLPLLAANRQVIAVDLQGHGRTADIDRPLSLEAMGDDVAALITYLGFEKADVMGFSMGAGTGLRTAIQHPERVRRLVVVSVAFRRDGSHPEVLEAMDQMGPAAVEPIRQSPLGQLYARTAPRPEDWPALVAKTADLLHHDYDWTAEVEAMTTPTLLVFADADSIRPEHIVAFYALLGGGLHDAGWDRSRRPVAQLAILPGTTHYDISTSPALAPAVTSFLDGALGAGA